MCIALDFSFVTQQFNQPFTWVRLQEIWPSWFHLVEPPDVFLFMMVWTIGGHLIIQPRRGVLAFIFQLSSALFCCTRAV